MSDSIPISEEGFARLKQELEKLQAERPEVIQAIKEAREEGDLKENAGYDAARERQGLLEAKIAQITSRMPMFNIIDLDTMDGNKVCYGATVEIENVDTGEVKKYTLLGPDETDFVPDSLSVFSPLARALMGREVGDETVVNAPKGKIEYEILDIKFYGSSIFKDG
ncbi:transcription elongation factor GreA [Desulfonatronospira thiodismutans ASO3-1]|uniref:Transcription elongation factor GreA n=1 Tax=Desulfonatronospira thiodismutans ASO3-1 TaxID=555779 RepID=D6SPI2_9BACT|nr:MULTISPECIES: transcription elongation factor GreA [Desulfonatronospira]EFI34658.1 transcription elongation factor GreA [Desulfonatronospira thiodismutans ASO3-1]RQD73172.1 MAG: transcription elongation factor GreA [Desulfonatronospira sp. MSAO_Bac3]